MSLTTASTIDDLIAKHTADVRHSSPRIHIAAASSGSPLLYSGLGGTSQVPPLDAPLEDAPPLKETDSYWMASATKLVTVVAVLQLVESCLISLESDARDVLPGLSAVKRLDGFDSNGEPILVKNELPITIKQLITHTAGFSYDWSSPNGQQAKYREHTGLLSQLDPKCDRRSVLDLPLDYAPGTRRMYGPSNDWAGFVVEHLTGLSLEEYFQKHIFGPLGITDISFFEPKDHINMAKRVEPLPAPTTFVAGEPVHLSKSYCMGGGGLYGNPLSYLKFLRALLPQSDFKLIESDELRRMMFEPQLTNAQQRADVAEHCNFDLHPWAREALPELQTNLDWGFGGALVQSDLPSGRKAGSLCWSGLAGTYWVIDPASDLVFVVWSNILPFGDQSTFDIWKQVEPLIYQGLPQNSA